jgi:hypothetical protein
VSKNAIHWSTHIHIKPNVASQIRSVDWSLQNSSPVTIVGTGVAVWVLFCVGVGGCYF